MRLVDVFEWVNLGTSPRLQLLYKTAEKLIIFPELDRIGSQTLRVRVRESCLLVGSVYIFCRFLHCWGRGHIRAGIHGKVNVMMVYSEIRFPDGEGENKLLFERNQTNFLFIHRLHFHSGDDIREEFEGQML